MAAFPGPDDSLNQPAETAFVYPGVSRNPAIAYSFVFLHAIDIGKTKNGMGRKDNPNTVSDCL